MSLDHSTANSKGTEQSYAIAHSEASPTTLRTAALSADTTTTKVIPVKAEAPAADSLAGLKAEYADPLLKHLPAPGNFTAAEALDLENSGITIEAAIRNRIAHVTADEAFKLIGMKHAGLLFPVHDEGGRLIQVRKGKRAGLPYCRLKVETPYTEKNGKEARYLSPVDGGCEIYFPVEKTLKSADDLAAARRFRRLWAKQLFLTEGEKKAIALTEAGMPCIGISGVDCAGDKNEAGDKVLHPALVKFLFKPSGEGPRVSNPGADIVCFFDSDATHKKEVAGAMKRLSYLFKEACAEYCKDEVAELLAPRRLAERLKYFVLGADLEGNKNGGDDWIVRYGADSLRELASYALPMFTIKEGKPATAKSQGSADRFICAFSPYPWHGDFKGVDKERAVGMLATITAVVAGRNCALDGEIVQRFGGQTWAAANREYVSALPSVVGRMNQWPNPYNYGLNRDARRALDTRMQIQQIDRETNGGQWNDPKFTAYKNGVVNRETGELLPFSREQFLTHQLGYDYDPTATSPTIRKFINDRFANLQQRLAAQALVRITLEAKSDREYDNAFIGLVLGAPGTGKGTFVAVIRALLGGASGNLRKETMSRGLVPVHSIGKRMLIDTDFKGRMNDNFISVINRIASNEAVDIEHKYADSYERPLRAVPWLVMNQAPEIPAKYRGKDGIERRFVPLHFNQPPAKKDTGMLKKLLAELPGIHNWAHEFTYEQAMQFLTGLKMETGKMKDLLIESDPVVEWLTEYIADIDIHKAAAGVNEITLRTAHGHYSDWAKNRNYRPVGERLFAGRLQQAGVTREKDSSGNRPLCFPAELDLYALNGMRKPEESPPPSPPEGVEASVSYLLSNCFTLPAVCHWEEHIGDETFIAMVWDKLPNSYSEAFTAEE